MVSHMNEAVVIYEKSETYVSYKLSYDVIIYFFYFQVM